MAKRLTAQLIAQIRVLYFQDVPVTLIAKKFNCSHDAIERTAKKQGWERPKVPPHKHGSPDTLFPALTLSLKGQNGTLPWVDSILGDCHEAMAGIRATQCFDVESWHRRQQAVKLTDDMARRALGLDQSSGSVKFTLQVLQTAQPKPIKAQVVDAEIVEPKVIPDTSASET